MKRSLFRHGAYLAGETVPLPKHRVTLPTGYTGIVVFILHVSTQTWQSYRFVGKRRAKRGVSLHVIDRGPKTQCVRITLLTIRSSPTLHCVESINETLYSYSRKIFLKCKFVCLVNFFGEEVLSVCSLCLVQLTGR